MNLVLGNKRYGVHITTFRWGFACHVEFKGETYGGSWAL